MEYGELFHESCHYLHETKASTYNIQHASEITSLYCMTSVIAKWFILYLIYLK